MNDPEPDIEKGEINEESAEISRSRDEVLAKPESSVKEDPVPNGHLTLPKVASNTH